MHIKFENIILRDYMLSNVEDEVRWTTVETEWFYHDTPWMEIETANADELRFEIEVDGHHIGLVSSYFLNENFEYTPWNSIDQCKSAPDNNSIRGLEIEICDMKYCGKGIGTKTLTMLMEYYRSFGENRFLIETWSGNHRMIGCANKLGFHEIKRIKNVHNVNGI